MKQFETAILSLLTHRHTHTHSAVNEGGVHLPGLLYYICTQLPAEWKKETVRRRRGDFTVTKWSEGFGGEDTQHLWRTKQTTAADYSNRGLRRSAGQVEAFNSQLPNETQTTGRQQQTRKGTEPICSASRVSAHLAQTGGRAQPLTAETPLVLTRIKKKKSLQLVLCPYLASSCTHVTPLCLWSSGVEQKLHREVKKNKKGLWRRHQARDKRKWYYETLINISCVYYSLSSAHIWLISNRQFLTLDTDRTGRLRRCFSGLLRKTFPSQRMEMDPPDWSIGSHWFAL